MMAEKMTSVSSIPKEAKKTTSRRQAERTAVPRKTFVRAAMTALHHVSRPLGPWVHHATTDDLPSTLKDEEPDMTQAEDVGRSICPWVRVGRGRGPFRTVLIEGSG